MTITKIQQTKRGRISVYVDGEFVMAVEAESWRQSGLFEGCETDAEQLNGLLSQSRLFEAKRRALNMLASQDYSAGRLTERLSRRTGAQSAAEAVERMQELGLVDDEKYAARIASQLFEKGYGERRIRLELQKRRIENEAASAALEALDFSDSRERAAELISNRFHSLDSESERRRAASFLERYGYSRADTAFALRHYIDFENTDF